MMMGITWIYILHTAILCIIIQEGRIICGVGITGVIMIFIGIIIIGDITIIILRTIGMLFIIIMVLISLHILLTVRGNRRIRYIGIFR